MLAVEGASVKYSQPIYSIGNIDQAEQPDTAGPFYQPVSEKDPASNFCNGIKGEQPVVPIFPQVAAVNHALRPPTSQPPHKNEGNENIYSHRAMEKMEVQKFVITQELNSMAEVEKLQEKLSMYKAHLPLGKLFFLGVLAGWWCSMAVILVTAIAGGIPVDVRTNWPCLPRTLVGLFFPVGIFLIILFGGELFTGNAMCLLIGLFAKRVTIFELLYNWSVVLVANFTGCVFTVFMFAHLTELFAHEPWASFSKGIAVMKINLKPEVAFLRAIPANALVCTSVLLGQQARDMLGKLAAMWFPIMVFAICGFEHAIANMAFVPLGLMVGAHDSADYRVWLYQNLPLVILGNIVGGGLVVGGAEYFLFDWTKVLRAVQDQQTDLLRSSLQSKPAPMLPGMRQSIPAAGAKAPAALAPSVSDGPAAAPAAGYYSESLDPERVRRVFAAFDADRDGAVGAQELACAVGALGFRYPLPLLQSILAAEFGPADRVGLAAFEGLGRRLCELEGLGLRAAGP